MIELIDDVLRSPRGCLAIDGMCAAGKTTFADMLSKQYGCNVLHTDDFYLPAEMRSEQRYAQPGGGFYSERFVKDVLEKLHSGADFEVPVFCCRTMSYNGSITVRAGRPTIIEGAYSLLPQLGRYYDGAVFIQIPPELQRKRIHMRNPEREQMFYNVFIPREEHYFAACNIKSSCDVILSGNEPPVKAY